MKIRLSFCLAVALLLCGGMSFAQIVSGNMFMQGAYLEVGMQRTGALGTSVNQPSGYHRHGGSPPCGSTNVLASVYDWGKDGWTVGTPAYMGDYTLPGSPWEEWAIQVNGTMTTANSSSCGFSGTLTGSHTSFSTAGGRVTGLWNGSVGSGGALAIKKEHRIDTFGSAFIVTVTMTNTTGSPLPGVYYMRCCDPDNDQTWTGGGFTTNNTIVYQNDYYHRVMVTATGNSSTHPPLSLCTKDCRAKAMIFSSWPLSCTNLAGIWAGTATCLGTSTYTAGNTQNGDIAIGLVYNIGTILPGDSAVISYAYVYDGTAGLDSAFPEPQMVINGTAIDSVDTITSCMVTSGTTLNVDLIHADDKTWTWGSWTWAPAIGLSGTTGISNSIDMTAISSTVTYTITGTDSLMGSCEQKTFLLTVIPVSVSPPITHDTSFCINYAAGPIDSCASGSNLVWFTTATGGTGSTVAPTPSTTAIGTTTYYVSQGVSGCYSPRAFVNVTITDAPTVSLVNNGPLCVGDAMHIYLTDPFGTGYGSYTWSGPGSFTSTAHDILINPVAYADSGVYTVVANYAGCATDPTSSTLVVHSTPGSPTIVNPTYCQYLPASPLTAVGSNLLWYTSATGGTGSSVAPTPSTSTPGTFTYYVTQTIFNCESARYPVVVTVNPEPAPPTISNVPGFYCPGAPYGSYSYGAGTGSVLWYSASSGGIGSATAPVLSTAAPGSYTIWASQTLLGCEGPRSPVYVTVYDSVKAHFTPTINWGCHGDTVIFSNSTYGGVNYLWNFGDGTSSAATSPTHIFNHQGVYDIRLYAHSYTCVDSTMRTLDLTHKDSSGFALAPSIVCQNLPVSFTNHSIATTPAYRWIFGDGTTDTATSPSHTYTNTGTYTVALIATDFVPCSDTSYSTVSVDTLSAISMTLSDTTMCRGTYITMSTDYSTLGNIGLTWALGNGDTVYDANPISYSYPAVGTFTITATASYRVCPASVIMRTVYVASQPTIDLGPDTSICEGSETSITLSDRINAGNTAASWLWSTGETGAGIGVATSGMYYATVSIGGCSATDSIWVGNDCYVSVPNCFTPNKDGVNDYFNPRDYFTKGCNKFKLCIYNRWGQKLFETENVEGRGWDGMYNGTEQLEGVYIYTLTAEFVDGQRISKQGNITLVK